MNNQQSPVKSQKIRFFTFYFLLFTFYFLPFKAQAQIIPDNTLPVNSVTNVNGNTISIEGGTQTGSNLFHSFQEFSVPTNNTAFFNNSIAIQNILTRVTGNSISNIDGLIQTNGVANLFLLNPNGIIFGPNARLNIGGSFLASTANSISFADRTQFSTQPTQTNPLLSISTPVGLQFGGNGGTIVNRSRITDTNNIAVGLQVQTGRNLSLIGGDIQLEGGILTAERGRIDLASLRLGDWSLITSEQTSTNNYGDISLSQQAQVNASGAGGGNVQVQGRQIRLTDGSQIKVNTLGSEAGGNLFVNASESVELIGRLADGTPSALQARVESGATGTGGNVTINTGSLRVENGARVANSSLQASGNAGNIRVNATDAIELIGVGNATVNGQIIEQPSGLYSQTTGTGKAGNIEIQTGQLIARDGGQVSSETFGSGEAGNLTINANDILLNGRSPNGSEPSGLLARVETSGTGNAGNLNIQTNSLRVENGARIAAATLGKTGNAGNLNITANDAIELSGVGNISATNTTPTQISGITQGSGRGGTIIIQTGQLTLRDGGQISASTLATGQAGDLTVNANQIQVIGRSPDGSIPSGILARVETSGTGNAGKLNIQTNSLRVEGGGRIAAATRGETGDAGNLNINATDSIEIIGVYSILNQITNPTQISANTEGAGQAGEIAIETGRLILQDGGQISGSTSSSGNAATLTIKANEIQILDRSFDGSVPSGILARVETDGTGNAGKLNIETNSLQVEGGARIAASTLGKSGNAGNLTINATDNIEVIGVGTNANGDITSTQISAITQGAGQAGNIEIKTGQLITRDGGQVIASTSGSGNASSLTVSASQVNLIGRSLDGKQPSGLLARVETPEASGNAGNITINTDGLLVQNGARIAAASLGKGNAGNVKIQANDTVEVTGVGTNFNGTDNPAQISVLSTETGNPGNINIQVPRLLLNYGGNLTAASATGSGGNIAIGSQNIQLRNQGIISANAGPGGAEGNITISTETIVMLEASKIFTDAANPQGGSNILILSPSDTGLGVLRSQDSTISARGELTVEGEVQVQPPDLPQVDVVDATNLIARTCPARTEDSSFYVTGRGGLPASPNDVLTGDIFWEDLRIPGNREREREREDRSYSPNLQSPKQIVEAQGWIISAKGEIILTPEVSNPTPHQVPLIPSSCL